jgi:DNA polymerase III alpha subunit (gram-positive type)
MNEAASFVGDIPLVAHNASFDSKFWDAELALIKQRRRQEFACSLLLARRILPQAPSHKLGDLIQFADLPRAGRAHRALADAEMAASLLQHLEEQLCSQFNVTQVTHELLRRIQGVPKAKWRRDWRQHHSKIVATQSEKPKHFKLGFSKIFGLVTIDRSVRLVPLGMTRSSRFAADFQSCCLQSFVCFEIRLASARPSITDYSSAGGCLVLSCSKRGR